MTPSRLRRLQADYARATEVFSHHPFIRLVEALGDPPDRFTFEFAVKGLREEGESLQEGATHRAEVFLPLDYPRRPPVCRMLTPVFHPNIDSQKICIGDHWSAGQSLLQLTVRIGEMICYQSYNTRSPLNAKAAAWAESNLGRLPLERADLSVGL